LRQPQKNLQGRRRREVRACVCVYLRMYISTVCTKSKALQALTQSEKRIKWID